MLPAELPLELSLAWPAEEKPTKLQVRVQYSSIHMYDTRCALHIMQSWMVVVLGLEPKRTEPCGYHLERVG